MTTSHHFVFVHGASHGAWCWYKVKTLLEASGHKVTCLDLEGAGITPTDPNTVFTMEAYNQPLYLFLSALPDNEKVILVGHSIGGATVIHAMCLFSKKISMAVFVAAFMLRPASSSSNIETKRFIDRLVGASSTELYDYIYAQGNHQEPTGMIMKKEYQRQKFYNESPSEDSVLASMLLRPAPYRALQGVLESPEAPAEVERVPRVFMKTSAADHMFSQLEQEGMILLWPPSRVYKLVNTDHSAFFSNPTALVGCLIEAAATIE